MAFGRGFLTDIWYFAAPSSDVKRGALARHDVKVVREYSVLPPVCVEKHKLLQILINLVSNAKYACEASGGSNKQMTLRILHENNRIKIAVIDTGVGISKENLTRIFAYGFTTKKEGHGFGLQQRPGRKRNGRNPDRDQRRSRTRSNLHP